MGAAGLDWAGFFPYSAEEGTASATFDGTVRRTVMAERLREVSELQDRITAAARDALVGETVEVLVDGTEDGMAVGRTHREAPEIDGVVQLEGEGVDPGEMVAVEVVGAAGPDLVAHPRSPVSG